MNKLEFYTKLIQENGLSKEILTELLCDIGKAYAEHPCNLTSADDSDVMVDFEDDSMSIEHEITVYGRCGEWHTERATIYVFWEELVENFLDCSSREEEVEQQIRKLLRLA